MDGTLLDSERLARACFIQACADLGWDVDIAVYDQCVGATHAATRDIMRAGFGPQFPYADMEQRWSELYRAHVYHKPVDKKPGIAQLLQHLKQQGIPMAVVTSSQRPVVEQKLARAELIEFFEFLVCGGETLRGKPHPQPYVAALDRLALQPARVWAIEDSDNGVRSAHAAGLVVFQIPDEIQPDPEIVALGHCILDSAVQVADYLR
jgi:HAD superfamily hydrolase (TIGR01509 family)